ncbi:MAG: nitrate/nitrite transporter NrtS [Pseudomonadota bacterium]
MPRWLQLAMRTSILRRSATVGIVVGTVLVAINQGDRLIAGLPPDWVKALLTYCVPFCVSTYGSVTALLGQEAGSDGAVAARKITDGRPL